MGFEDALSSFYNAFNCHPYLIKSSVACQLYFERAGSMASIMTFDGNKYAYIQMPSLILNRKDMDMDAKFLYAYLFTTGILSFSKNFKDKNGIYVYVSFLKLFNWRKELIKSKLTLLEELKLIKIVPASNKYLKSKVYIYDFDDTEITEYFSPNSIQRSSFLMIPFAFAFENRFMGISTDAMILYALYIDYKNLSIRNSDFIDQDNNVFVKYSFEDASRDLNWSRTKFYRVNLLLKKFGLIDVKQAGNGQVNRIYPKDYLFSKTIIDTKLDKSLSEDISSNPSLSDVSKSDIEDTKNYPLNKQMFQNQIADVSKTDVSKSDIENTTNYPLNEQMFQNQIPDVSKSDVSKVDVSKVDTNNPEFCISRSLIISNSINQIILRLIDDKFSLSEDKLKLSEKIKLDNELSDLLLNSLDSIEEDTLFNFIDFQINFNELYEYYLNALDQCINHEDLMIRSKKFEFDIALSTLEGVKAILIGIYTNDPSVTQLISNCKYLPLNIKRNFLKLRSNDFELIITRVQNYIFNDGAQRVIENLPAFLLKTMNNHASSIIRKFI